MAKIQARNVDDALYQRIEMSAMRNERSLEGEIRLALQQYYQPPVDTRPVLSLRERWQQETGQRLQWLFDRLMEDNFFRESFHAKKAGVPELIRLSRRLGVSPGMLMDITEGRHEMTLAQADTIAGEADASADWLLSGTGRPFQVASLGSEYRDFFLPPGDDCHNAFEFIRIASGRHAGTLICLRINSRTGDMSLGAVTAEFMLCNEGCGGTGHGKLLSFLLFLKTQCAHLAMNAFDWGTEEPGFDFWSVVGQHHPVYFQDFRHRSTAGWLQQVLSGQDPDAWFNGWGNSLVELRDTPFGCHPEKMPDEATPAVSGTEAV